MYFIYINFVEIYQIFHFMWNHFGSIFVIFDTDIHGVNDILNFMIDLKKNIN